MAKQSLKTSIVRVGVIGLDVTEEFEHQYIQKLFKELIHDIMRHVKHKTLITSSEWEDEFEQENHCLDDIDIIDYEFKVIKFDDVFQRNIVLRLEIEFEPIT